MTKVALIGNLLFVPTKYYFLSSTFFFFFLKFNSNFSALKLHKLRNIDFLKENILSLCTNIKCLSSEWQENCTFIIKNRKEVKNFFWSKI